MESGWSARSTSLRVLDYRPTQNRDAGTQFRRGYGRGSRLQAQLLVRQYDFSGVGSVCDVGGGTGTVLAEVLKANARARGTLFDLPSVLAKVSHELDGVADRCALVGGDFSPRFQRVTTLHAAGDRPRLGRRPGVDILKNVRTAMPPGGRAIVVDSVMPDHDRADLSKQFDVLMLVLTGSVASAPRWSSSGCSPAPPSASTATHPAQPFSRLRVSAA